MSWFLYNNLMTHDTIINQWLASAERNVTIAQDNFKLTHYDWALFFWHLVLEKTLKAILLKKEDSFLPIHDLYKLAVKAQLPLSEEHIAILKEATTFNIEARYDDYKRSFYHKATKNYTQEWMDKCRRVYQWLQKQF